jgi:hypothetical protein
MIDTSASATCFVCFLPGTASMPLLHRVCGCSTMVHAACMERTLNTVASYADGACAVCKRRIVGAEPQVSVFPRTSAMCLTALCIALLLFVVAVALMQILFYMAVHELGSPRGDPPMIVVVVLVLCGVVALVAAFSFLHLAVANTPDRRVFFRMRDPALLV